MLMQAWFRLVILVAVGLVSYPAAFGQDKRSKPQSLAKDYIVGKWIAEGTVDGKAVTGFMRISPTAGGACLIYNWSYGPSPDKMVRGAALGGRDPNSTDFLEYCFESDGSHFISRFLDTPFPDIGVGHGERTGTINGKPYKGKLTVDRQGRAEFTFVASSDSGEDVRFTFRRVQEVAAVSQNYERLKALEDYIGDWVGEVTLVDDIPGFAKKGETVTNRPSLKWVLNKSAVQMDLTGISADGKAIDTRWLFGWDSSKNEIGYSGMDSGGSRSWGTLKKEGSDKWIWQMKWCSADTKEGSCTDVTTMQENNTVHVHEYTNCVADGKSQPDSKVVYKRVK